MASPPVSLEAFYQRLPFAADRFQREAIDVVAEGHSVLVTAPTGAGKTLIAEAAVHLALERGRRAFYTTPLKALSNQKYGDFGALHGIRRVGLLTGDNSVNGGAPVVVMTTEVLRNMIYAGSADLDDLAVVVLDEIHYLQDPFRGAVWEEIIVHLPQQVQIVGLSATVSNAGEFAEWMGERRGELRLVRESVRPVPLENRYLIKDRQVEGGLGLYPTFTDDGRPNPAVTRLLARDRRRGHRRRRFATPRRTETVEILRDEELLPAIYFIFSRAGCEDAARQVVDAGIRLTDRSERERIRQYAELRTAHLQPDDLAVLGYGRWLSNLEQGVAAHHAGMVPAFKEAVEELFAVGLVKLVFATETLALGINMPARTVVLESLSKFTGESHELLQPGDYTQLTGRAGRRGIDEVGYAVVLYSPYVPFDRVAAIAGAGSHPLQSSFRPTYNMAVNLVANYPQDRAEELLNASFGQFQRRVGLERLRRTRERNRASVEAYRRAAVCERGDVFEYLDELERRGEAIPGHRDVMRTFARKLHPGDIIDVPSGRLTGRFVMLTRGHTRLPRLLLLSGAGHPIEVRAEELPPGTARVGSMTLPAPFEPRSAQFQQATADALKTYTPEPPTLVAAPAVDGHPVGACPDAPDHLRNARRVRRLEREIRRLDARLERDRQGLVGEFRAVLELCRTWGYASGWSLTDKGDRLRFVYNERDLLVVESIEQGLLAGLDPPSLAGLASMFVYDPRPSSAAGEWPDGELEDRFARILEVQRSLAEAERARGLVETRAPEPGFVGLAYYWAKGADLEDLLGDDDLAAGDFVRTCRQLLDLLRQIRDAYPALSEPVGDAIKAIDRGVVAAGGLL